MLARILPPSGVIRTVGRCCSRPTGRSVQPGWGRLPQLPVELSRRKEGRQVTKGNNFEGESRWCKRCRKGTQNTMRLARLAPYLDKVCYDWHGNGNGPGWPTKW